MAAVWSGGFRPFFLCGAIWAVLILARWIVFWLWPDTRLSLSFPATQWHAHEMIFGFAGAVVAGFILTASPVWTQSKPTDRGNLFVLVAAWLIGRIVFVLKLEIPFELYFFLEMPFLILLTLNVANRLIRYGNRRNWIFIFILALFALSDFIFLFGVQKNDFKLSQLGIYSGNFILLILVIIIGGRVIPFFSQKAFPEFKVTKWKTIEILAIALSVLVIIGFLFNISILMSPILCFVTALVHMLRLWGWQAYRYLKAPLLWVLHLGYAWIAVFFLLLGFYYAGAIPLLSTCLHALNVGAIGGLIIGMMARVSLGHSGRPLRVSNSMAWAFGAMNLAAVIRLVPRHSPLMDRGVILISASFFIISLVIFVVQYWAILITKGERKCA